MRRLATMWQQLFPVEQCRLAQLLIEPVVIADGGLEIVWRDQGCLRVRGEQRLFAQLIDIEFAGDTKFGFRPFHGCRRRSNIDPPCRLNIDPGWVAAF